MKNVSIFFLSVLLFAVSCFAAQGNQQVAKQNNSLKSVEWEDPIRKMESLYLKGDIKGAIKIGNKYKKMAEESGNVDLRSYAKLLDTLGEYNSIIEDLEMGKEMFKLALKVEEKLGAPPVRIAEIQSKIGATFTGLGDFPEAERWLKMAEHGFDKVKSEKDLVFGGFLNRKAVLELLYYKNSDKAIALFEEMLHILKSSTAKDKDAAEILILCNIARSYMEIGNNEKAKRTLYKALNISRRIHGDHPNKVEMYRLMGENYTFMHNYILAENYYNKALHISENVLSLNSPAIGRIYNGLAGLYVVKKEYKKSEEYLHKAIDFNAKNLGEHTSANIMIENNLSYLYFLKSDYSSALAENNLALLLCKKNFQKYDEACLSVLDTRLQILRKIGKKEEALKYENLIKKYSNGNYN